MINNSAFKAAFSATALLAVLSLASCKKDDVTGNPPPGNNTARIAAYSHGDDQWTFQYNADKSLKTVSVKSELFNSGEETAYNITYRADKKMDVLSSTDGSSIRLQWNNGTLTGAETWVSNQKVSVTSYEYLNGFLKTVDIRMVYGNNLVPFMKFSFVYNNAGNIGRTNIWSYNFLTSQLEFTGHSEMEYDSNPSPFADMKELMAVFWQTSSGNNITRITQYEPGGQEEEKTSYTYTYNSKRLPVSAVVTTTSAGQQPVNSTAQFTYVQ